MFNKISMLLLGCIFLTACSSDNVKIINDKLEQQSSFILEELGDVVQYMFTEDAIYCSNIMTFIKINKYDFEGKLLFEFGRNGEGPGEFAFVNAIYQDAGQHLIGIPDMTLHRTTYIDSLGSLIKIEKFTESKTLYQAVSSSTATLKRFIEFSTIDGERVSHNTFILERADSSPKLIYEYCNPVKLSYEPNGSGTKFSWMQMNEEFIFYSNPYSSRNEYEIKVFDYDGNMHLWKPDFIPRGIPKLNMNYVTDENIFINSYKDEKNYVLIYDFSGEFLGFIELVKGQNLLGVKGDKMFVIDKSGDDNRMEIYRIKKFTFNPN